LLDLQGSLDGQSPSSRVFVEASELASHRVLTADKVIVNERPDFCPLTDFHAVVVDNTALMTERPVFDMFGFHKTM